MGPRLLLPVLFCSSACHFGPGPRLPSRLSQVPGPTDPLQKELDALRLRAAAGSPKEALAGLDGLLRRRPEHVGSQRLRQDLLRQRGRHGLMWEEALTRLRRAPNSAGSLYLRGRLAPDDAGKAGFFDAAIAAEPEVFWGWYGKAFTLRRRDPGAAQALYKGLFRATKRLDRGTGVAYAASLRQPGTLRQAMSVYALLRGVDPGLGALGLAEVLVGAGKWSQARQPLLQALRARPFDAGVRNLLSRMLARGVSQAALREIVDELETEQQRLEAFATAGPGLAADLFQRLGDPGMALQLLAAAPQLAPADRRLYRHLLLRSGRVRECLADVQEGMLKEFLEAEGNQVRGRWQALFAGPWMQRDDPLGELATATGLVTALRDVGHLELAREAANLALFRSPGEDDASAGLHALRGELRRELAFEAALRRLVQRGYEGERRGEIRSLDATLEALRKVSLRTLGRDVVGTPARLNLPLVGTLLDPQGSGLPAHFARYNRHLVLGQFANKAVEGMIVTRLSVQRVAGGPDLPMPAGTVEIVGEHRQLNPLHHADLAGIALVNHYVVDMDEVRNWAGTLARRRRIAAADGRVLLRDPVPEGLPDLAPVGVDWRLNLLSPVRDQDLTAAVLDIIRWHERGHMADFLHFLPWQRKLIRGALLLVRNNFDQLQVVAEGEGRAELAALAFSPHTRLVLAHIAGFLEGEAGSSPHAHGFRAIAQDLVDALRAADPGSPAAVRHWHTCDPARLRELAQQQLRDTR